MTPGLREVTVEEKRESMALFRTGFYDRQRASIGYFLLRMDISIDRRAGWKS